MRRPSRGWLLAAIAVAAVAVLGLAACGDDDNSAADTSSTSSAEITLRLAYVTTADHPYGVAINQFIKDVGTASGGKIAIEGLPNYPGDVPLLQDVKGGAVEMASVSSAVWGTQGVNCFDALQALGLITRYDLEKEVIEGPIGKSMLACTSAAGVHGLAIHEGGLRKPLGAKVMLTSPSTFKGKKIRTPASSVLQTGISALGADPVTIATLPEIYPALRDGTVDGMEANLGLVQTLKLYEVAKYITANINLWPFPTVLVMNQAKWDALSADQQATITAAAEKVPGFSIGIFTAPSELPATLCSEGLKFAVANDSDLAAFNKVSQQVITELSKNAETKGYIDQIQALKDALPAPPAPAPLPEGCAVNS